MLFPLFLVFFSKLDLKNIQFGNTFLAESLKWIIKDIWVSNKGQNKFMDHVVLCENAFYYYKVLKTG